jgi:hypothetical protein
MFRAVKVVYRASFDSERPYEREFNGLQKFEPVSRTHPGLMSLLHIGRNAGGGHFYCIMELADDVSKGQAIEPETYRPRTLAGDISQRGRLPLKECVELGMRLAAALGHLHSRGLVHRDIKPSNIIFVNGEPKLADIGLVTQIGTKTTFVGTEDYLAPEGPGGPGADIYALGKLLYEVGMGKSAEQFPELPTRLRELPEAPGLMRLNGIVLKACQQQVGKRFRSAEELEGALAELGKELGGDGGAKGGPGSGKKIVVICPSTVAVEDSLARLVAERLGKQGYGVFVEAGKGLSVEWGRAIEQRIRGAQMVIAILSPETVQSEVMAYGLEMAQLCGHEEEKRPRVIGICVGIETGRAGLMVLGLEQATMIAAEGDAERIAVQVEEAVAAEIMKEVGGACELDRRGPNDGPLSR